MTKTIYLRDLIRTLTVFCVVGLAGTLASGQTHLGTIRGVILDPSGAAVVDAVYRLVSQETGVTRTGSSGTDGRYNVPQLEPGSYRLEVEVSGYKLSVSEATLAVDQRLRLDVRLDLGTLSEQVVVTAPEPALDRVSTGLGTVLDNQQLLALPLDGRNFLELALLAPGTSPAAPGSAGSVRGDFTFNAGGGRDDANSYLLDGAYNVDSKLNTPAVRPPVDAIQEFKVLTNGSDASFGRNAGAQVNQGDERAKLLCAGQRTSTRLQAVANRVLAWRSPRREPDILLLGLRGNATVRGHHARHKRADGRRAAGGFLE